MTDRPSSNQVGRAVGALVNSEATRGVIVGVILLIRHGQANFGSRNYDTLSATGLYQTELLGLRLSTVASKPRTVLSGGLQRQRQTATAAFARMNLVPDVDDRWDEYDHTSIAGDQSEFLVFAETDKDARNVASSTLDDAIQRWIAGGVASTETHRDFLDRCECALESVASHPGVTAVVTSGGVIAAICARLLDLPPERWPLLARVVVNTSVTKIVAGGRGLSLVSFNDHSHLEQDHQLITYR